MRKHSSRKRLNFRYRNALPAKRLPCNRRCLNAGEQAHVFHCDSRSLMSKKWPQIEPLLNQ